MKHFLRRILGINEVTAEIAELRDLITKGFSNMAKTLDDLIAQGQTALDQITKNTDLDNSIIALVNANTQTIKDLRAQLATAGTDPAKLEALGAIMDGLVSQGAAQGQAVADAVTANTGA